jgi:hypothetical protein
MTEYDYQTLLEKVEAAITSTAPKLVWVDASDVPLAANDNDCEWPLLPFPEGWHASP